MSPMVRSVECSRVRTVYFRRCLRILLLIAATLLGAIANVLAEEAYVGRIESVDPSILRITIKTDSGRMESFSVGDGTMLRQLKIDDYVQVETGSDGLANRVMKLPASEGRGRSPAGNADG